MNSPDIIKDASGALQQISDRGITVMQGWYDKNIHKTHVTLWDLGEDDENFSDDDAEGVTLSLQVTIFSESDEVELAREIKKTEKSISHSSSHGGRVFEFPLPAAAYIPISGSVSDGWRHSSSHWL